MQNNAITKAYIRKNSTNSSIEEDIRIQLSDVKTIDNAPYMLIIQSSSEKCIRITIYPINRKEILKISIKAQKIPNNMINILSKILKNYEIIHTSGILAKNEYFIYECYINLNFSDQASIDLKKRLDKIKDKFNQINIEQITLKVNSKE